MTRTFKSFICLIAVVFLFSLTSCSDDGVGLSSSVDYGKMQLGSMNLSGAKQLALKTDSDNSRAIDGQYLSAGLYKIDENGNISAVAVYFTTDTLGNRLEKEYALKVVPTRLFQLTNDFALVVNCKYYDADGDLVADRWIADGEGEDDSVTWVQQDVPYKNLLIRLTDGKIWCVDNIINRIYSSGNLKGSWLTDNNGNLIFVGSYDRSGVYRFNLSNQDASFEQILNIDWYFDYNSDGYHIADNGVFWGKADDELGLFWPQSGYQIFDTDVVAKYVYPGYSLMDSSTRLHYLNSEGEEVLEEDPWYVYYYVNSRAFYGINNYGNPGIIYLSSIHPSSGDNWHVPLEWYKEYIDFDVAWYFDIAIGDTPGSAKLTDPITLGTKDVILSDDVDQRSTDDYTLERGGVYEGDGYILYYEGSERNRLSKIDLNKREWTILKTLDRYYSFSMEYADKVWSLEEDNLVGAYWLDLTTFEEGFVPFNVTIPEWMSLNDYWHSTHGLVYVDIANGYIKYSGTNPSNLNYEEIYIDLLTGEASTSVTTPTYSFETLISLN